MRKKLLAALFTAAACACLVAGVTACSEEHSHTLTGVESVAATCTEAGNIAYYYCTECGKYFSDGTAETELAADALTIPATGHSYTAEITDPTCTEQGYTTYTCSACGDSYTENGAEAAGHVWDGGIVSTAAACTSDGTRVYTCTVCGATTEESIAAAGHVWDGGVAVQEPTCTENGSMKYTCLVCGGERTEEIAALGHSYGSAVTTPTCTEQGYTTYTCNVCGDYYVGDYVEATGHTYELTGWTWDGFASAKAEFTCTAGDDSLQVSAEITDAVTKESTCLGTGVRTYTASAELNGAIYTDSAEEILPALGHNYVSAVTDPTCTAQGYTEYICSACGDTYVDNYVVATGHTYVLTGWVWDGFTAAKAEFTCTAGDSSQEMTAQITDAVTKEATCLGTGVRTYTAAVTYNGTQYTDEKTEEIAALGHRYAETTVAPTCTAQGYTTYTCSACGDTYDDNYVAAAGHTYNVLSGWVWGSGYTSASAVFACSACGETMTIRANISNETTSEADCTRTGTVVHKASVTYDGTHYTDEQTETIAALGHSYVPAVTDPTCTAQGYTTYTCGACGDYYVGDYVEATGHTYELTGWTWDGFASAKAEFTCTAGDSTQEMAAQITAETTAEATCTESGTKTYTAAVTFNNMAYTDEQTETIAALGHSLAYNAAVAAGTYTEGSVEYWFCSVCGKYFADEDGTTELSSVTVAALGEQLSYSSDGSTCTVTGIGTVTTAIITIPSVYNGIAVTAIAENAFLGCTGITEIVIADSVTSIGHDAFHYCSSLTSVYYNGTASGWSAISIDSSNIYLTNATIYYYAENDGTTTAAGNYWYYDSEGNIKTWSIAS